MDDYCTLLPNFIGNKYQFLYYKTFLRNSWKPFETWKRHIILMVAQGYD